MLSGLVEREYRLLRSGGYIYLYHTLPPESMKKIARLKLKHWYETIGRIIEEFGE